MCIWACFKAADDSILFFVKVGVSDDDGDSGETERGMCIS